MTTATETIGLSIIHRPPLLGEAVDLDNALSRPVHASVDYLYGLYGKTGPGRFNSVLSNAGGDPAREVTKALFKVPYDPTAKFGASLSGLKFLPKKPREDVRRLVQQLICDVAAKKHGVSERLEHIGNKGTEAGFQDTFLAYPECVIEALSVTDIEVAIFPAYMSNGMSLWVSVVAKKSVDEFLLSVATEFQTNRRYGITDLLGDWHDLAPAPLTRPLILHEGRAGTQWRRGKFHPGGTGLPTRSDRNAPGSALEPDEGVHSVHPNVGSASQAIPDHASSATSPATRHSPGPL